MRISFIKPSMLAAIGVLLTLSAKAQQVSVSGSYSSRYDNYHYVNDSAGHHRDIVHTFFDNNEYKFVLTDGEVSQLCINGKTIPADQYSQYNDVIKRIKEQIAEDEKQAEEDRKQAVVDRAQAEEDRKQAVVDQAQAEQDRKQADEDRKQAEQERKQDQAQAEQDRKQAGQDSIQAVEDRKQAEQERIQGEQDRKQAVSDQAQAEEDRKQAVQDRIQADQDRKQAVQDQAQAVDDRKQAEQDRIQADQDRKQAEEDRKIMTAFLAEVVKDGLAPDKESINHITLNSSGMTVNDKPVSADVFNRYYTKYKKWADCNFSYGIDHASFNGMHFSKMN